MVAEDQLYSLDIPQKEGIQGYIGTFFTLFLKLATVLQSPEFSKEPVRVFYMVEFIISLIPEPSSREIIRQKHKELRLKLETEYKKDNKKAELNQQERDHLLIVASLQILGDVSYYIDEFMGISVKNKIGFIKKKDGTLESFDKTKHADIKSSAEKSKKIGAGL